MSETRDAQTLGAFVRNMRLLSQDTQQRLASRIGSYTKRIANIENGHSEPTMADLVCLARSFEITPIDLYCAFDEALTDGEEDADATGDAP